MSYVICVENDAKVDARCHTLKIDIGYLKCTKIDAKEKEKKEKKKKIGMSLFKMPFFTIKKVVYTRKKSNFQVKDTDRMENPRIPTNQKIV